MTKQISHLTLLSATDMIAVECWAKWSREGAAFVSCSDPTHTWLVSLRVGVRFCSWIDWRRVIRNFLSSPSWTWWRKRRRKGSDFVKLRTCWTLTSISRLALYSTDACWLGWVKSYVFNLLLQQLDDLPLTVQHLNVEVDDDADGKKKQNKTRVHQIKTCVWGRIMKHILALTHRSQEDGRCHEQDEGMLHQVGVSPRQRGQVGVVLLQLLHQFLTRLEHGVLSTEGAARRGGRNAEDGRRTDNRHRTHCF